MREAARTHATTLLAIAVSVTAIGLATAGHAGLATAVAVAGLAATTIASTAARRRARARVGVLQADLHEALTDPVTGLPVRRVAQHHLDTATAGGTLALVDVDRLHQLNNRYGHGFGDAYLRAVATALTDAAPGGLVARLGGDEFLIATAMPPHHLAAALTARLATPARIGSNLMPLQVSVGICPIGTGDALTALACADLAMYAAKHQGGGIEHYQPARHGTPPPPGTRPAIRRRDHRRRTAGR